MCFAGHGFRVVTSAAGAHSVDALCHIANSHAEHFLKQSRVADLLHRRP
jgi:hypothetical protein